MNTRLLSVFFVLLLITSGHSVAQNAIGIRECVIEPMKSNKAASGALPYVLKLKLRCSLASQEVAYLKVAIDPKEEQNFQTVAEKRLRQGKGIPWDLEVPIEDWKTEKLSIFILMQNKDPKPDDMPLANVTKTIERASVKKE